MMNQLITQQNINVLDSVAFTTAIPNFTLFHHYLKTRGKISLQSFDQCDIYKKLKSIETFCYQDYGDEYLSGSRYKGRF